MSAHNTTCCSTQACCAAPQPYALLAEFDNVTDLLASANKITAAGYTKTEAHTPFPVHGIDDALNIKPTILPWLVLFMGLMGMTTGLLLTSYTMVDWLPIPSFMPENIEGYRFIISGKPMFALAAFIPVIFELTIMFAAYTAVFAMYLLSRLPMLYHPLFKNDRFRRATQDRFFLVIEADDPKYAEAETTAFMQSLPGIVSVERVDD